MTCFRGESREGLDTVAGLSRGAWKTKVPDGPPSPVRAENTNGALEDFLDCLAE